MKKREQKGNAKVVKMKKYPAFITLAQYNALEAIAEETGTTKAELNRRAIDLFLAVHYGVLEKTGDQRKKGESASTT